MPTTYFELDQTFKILVLFSKEIRFTSKMMAALQLCVYCAISLQTQLIRNKIYNIHVMYQGNKFKTNIKHPKA